MKVDLDKPIIFTNGKPAKHDNKTEMTVGDMLALPVGSVDLNVVRTPVGQKATFDAALTRWQGKMARQLANGGEINLISSDVSQIVECVQNGNIQPWMVSILLWRLGECPEDEADYFEGWQEKTVEESSLSN